MLFLLFVYDFFVRFNNLTGDLGELLINWIESNDSLQTLYILNTGIWHRFVFMFVSVTVFMFIARRIGRKGSAASGRRVEETPYFPPNSQLWLHSYQSVVSCQNLVYFVRMFFIQVLRILESFSFSNHFLILRISSNPIMLNAATIFSSREGVNG